MNDLAKYTSRLAKAVASGERVLDVLDTELTIADAPDAIPAVQLRGAVTFDHVYFSYLPGHEILQDIHVQIEPGQRVAVVGPSGGGKSTLLSLLPRLYEPTGGQVLLDGKDIRCYTLKSLRNQISVVPQESMLFGVGVRENIAYGAPGASDAEIEAAARLASAHDFILNLPDGYDTILGEGGATLSGGQRQRIAVARAALRQSALVILDEPTASLDNENEQIVYDALERLVKGRTSFWITHDLRAAERADLILYIEDGRIQEQGTHAELLDLNGRYAAIYAIQAQIRGRDEARVPDVQKGEIAYALAR
jgi:ATP-binding cassette subfamily B protein